MGCYPTFAAALNAPDAPWQSKPAQKMLRKTKVVLPVFNRFEKTSKEF
jgi:hypothetical protein